MTVADPRLARPLPVQCAAVISDVDGTLVTNDKMLTAATRAATAELRSNGLMFSIVSSRPPRGMLPVMKALGIDAPVAGFNGGVVTGPDLAVMSVHLLSPAVARRTVAMLDERGADVWVFSGEDWLVRRPDGPYVGLEQRTVAFGPTIVEDFGSALDATAKIVGVSADFAALARCEGELGAALGEQACVVRSQQYYLDVTHPLANKGDAVATLAKLMNVPLARVVVIGDGHNDMAMFARAGFSIAMGNANPEVQKAAKAVVGSNSEDGFAQAIGQYVLGDARSPARAEVAKTGDRAW
jgi:Cof subfamily protein (haloacid dehalogenase superfamily)